MGAAVREGRTQLVNDIRSDPRYLCPPGVTAARAELAVPICLGDRVLGVVNVEGDRPFDELDRRSLEVIADYLAVAIDNSQLSGKVSEDAPTGNRELERALHAAIKKVTHSVGDLRFNTAIAEMMVFVNEATKATAVPRDWFEAFVKILSAFAPHL
jgi:GAF domain-containing protein